MARYLLIVTFEPGVVDSPMEEWRPEEITAHLDYYRALNTALEESGELVDVTILTPPDAARIVRADTSGGRVVTDGPFQEFKEWAAGFQVIDVETEERALEIAALARPSRGRAGCRSSSRSTCVGSWTTGRPTPPRWTPGWRASGAGAERRPRRRRPAARPRAAGRRHPHPPVR